MKSLTFAKRNLKEFFRSPIMLFFTLLFPLIMFFIFQIIKVGTGATIIIAPMFATKNLICSIAVFSYSFVALNLSIQIAKDRDSSFMARLQISPLKAIDFFWGYVLPNLIITAIQTLLCVIIGFCFGLKPTLSVIYATLCLFLSSLLYVSLGVFIGCVFKEKNCGAISSLLVNVTAIFSGMFFPLNNGAFKTILSCFPFLPSIAIPQGLLANHYENFFIYVSVLIIYMVISIFVSVFAFNKKLKTQ